MGRKCVTYFAPFRKEDRTRYHSGMQQPEQGQWIKARRAERGWSQAELARRARVHPCRISHIERGFERLWPGYERRLARALGLPVRELREAAGS